MKKIIVIVVFFLTAFVLTACSKETTTKSELLNTTKDVYGFEAMSSITLLDSMNSNQQATLSVKPFSYTASKLGYEDEVTEEEIDEINKYLGIMEQMLADDQPISAVDEVSDRAEYTNKLVISTKDLNLNVYTYVLYYNEEVLTDEDDEDETDEQEDSDEDKDDEDEVESSLQGIMIVGEKEYVVSGKKELEEDEMKVEFTSILDETNWVTVKQKTENDESKFEYTISENGVISVTEMKYEKEDDETKLKLEFKQGEIESKYQFKIEEEDDQKVIKIEIKDETRELEVKVYVIVDPVTEEVTYEYKIKDSDKSFKKDRENAHDEEDDGREDQSII